MIAEDYVSFEIAKLLKEKGFDGECQGYYEVPTKLSSQKDVRKQLNALPKNWNEYNKECVVCEYISIPTHQMALKWLREVHKIYIAVNVGCDVDNENYVFYSPMIVKLNNKSVEYIESFGEDDEFDSNEKAVEAALDYILKNLI